MEIKVLTKDLEVSEKVGSHQHLVHLMGLCEDRETILVAVDDTDDVLKQILLDSRALKNYPVYAEKNSRFSTLSESHVIEYLIGVSKGMQHLHQMKVNFLSNN